MKNLTQTSVRIARAQRALSAPKASLIAAAVATSLLVAACGGGGNDAFDTASSIDASRRGSSTTLTIASPTANASVSGTVAVKGNTGSQITTVTIVDTTTNGTIATAKPSSGAFSANVDTTKLANGSHTWQVTASNSTNGVRTVQNVNVTVANKAATTTTPATTKGSIFYGVNGHNNEGGAYSISSPALQLQQLKDLGATMYRNEVFSQASATNLANVAKTITAGGVTVYPVMLIGLDYNSENDAYNAGYTLGKQTATAYKYPYYEVTNELEADALVGNVDGVYPQDFDNAKFQRARGVIRGLIDGVKSVDPNGKIVMGGGAWMHTAFDQMLANGTQPDGTTGHPVVGWDITAWHWYSDQGDITNACGGTGCHDILATLKALGKPIWINEFGVRPNYGSDQQIASYLVGNQMMAEFVSVAKKYNITSIQSYELYDDPPGGEGNYGLLQNDGKTPKAAYTSWKNFVSAHPM